MKMRLGFVTNSSSSSFVLAFENQGEYDEFKTLCELYNYEDFLKLIDRGDNNTSKNEASDIVKSYWYSQVRDKIYSDLIPDFNKLSYLERAKMINEIEKTDEYAKELEGELARTTYSDMIDMINDSEIIIADTIWDTDGGIIEWAIRNGFIESEFPQYCVLVYNVG